MPKADAQRGRRSETGWEDLVAAGCLFILVVAIWAPFGLHVTGEFEEWISLQGLQSQGRIFYPGARPLIWAPYALGHLLTPGSFVGANLLQIAAIFGKGLFAYLLCRHFLPIPAAQALLIGALVILSPADTGSFTLRTLNVHMGLFLLLGSLYFLFLYISQRRRWIFVVSLILEFLSLLVYDAGIPIVLIMSIMLIWKIKKAGPALRWATLLWSAVAVLAVSLTLREFTIGYSYHRHMFQGPGQEAGQGIQRYAEIATSFVRALRVCFFEGWKNVILQLDWMRYDTWSALFMSIFVLAPAMFWLGRRDSHANRLPDARVSLSIVGCSVFAVLIAFAPFSLTIWRNSSWRVFMYASVASAIGTSALGWLISSLAPRIRTVSFSLLGALLVFWALAGAIRQHGDTYAKSWLQQELLSRVIELAPKPQKGTKILVLDKSPDLAFQAFRECAVPSDCLTAAFQYIYQDNSLEGIICGYKHRLRREFSESCDFQSSGLQVEYVNIASRQHISKTYRYKDLLIFERSLTGVRLIRELRELYPEQAPVDYHADAAASADAPLPAKAKKLFAEWPPRQRMARRLSQASLRLDFGQPVSGEGWFEPERAGTWTRGELSWLDYPLKGNRSYDLTFRIKHVLKPELLANLRVYVNEQLISLKFYKDEKGAAIFQGLISQKAVAVEPANTRIKFVTGNVLSPMLLGINDDPRQLGLLFDWLRVEPVSEPQR